MRTGLIYSRVQGKAWLDGYEISMDTAYLLVKMWDKYRRMSVAERASDGG